MADLAMSYHWTPETMRAMTPEDLIEWWESARERTEP